MAYVRHFVLLLSMLCAGLCNAVDYSILDFELAKEHELWMAKHGRVYKDDAEKARRFEIFKENVKYIEEFNSAGKHSYKLGFGPFTDLTNEEFAATYANIERPEWEPEELPSPNEYERLMKELDVKDVPDSVDWRDEGAVSSVKTQIYCECCWAMAAVATVESLIKIKNGILYDLSVQQLVDCVPFPKSLGCKGGWIKHALNYIVKNGGVTSWANYPYTDNQTTCDTTKEKAIVASIKSMASVVFSNELKLQEAVAEQPVGVWIEADAKEFQHYPGGIFDGPCGGRKTVNHFVVVVGYGEENGTKYWIIKNSWSDKWGESGYMRLKRDVGNPDGLCGVAYEMYYPQL